MSATLDDITHTDESLHLDPVHQRPLPVLHVVHHPDPGLVGRRVLLEPGDERILGRRREDLGPGVLDDPRLSREHATVAWLGSGVIVRDLDSRNGVWVNGKRVSRAGLGPGDVLGVGGMLLLLGYGPRRLPEGRGQFLLGNSAAMAEAVAALDAVARRDTTVLLVGETGTGKELAARELHARSGRPGPFVPVNCGAISAGVLHDELFGHAKGAFTGARARRPGLVGAAEGGTLFLDEIGDAPPELQVALLRLLQEKEVRAVGEDSARTVDVRVIAATWRDLDGAVAADKFRQDLAARLRRWTVRLPALRERREDLPMLAQHFARKFIGRDVGFSRGLMLRLLLYRWSDNVRELEAVVERLMVTAGETPVVAEPSWLAELLGQDGSAADAMTGPGQADGAGPRMRRPVERPSLATLQEMLSGTSGNVRALSERLGVSRNTLYKWFRHHGIDPADFR
ncbi:MAG: sigma 54-interacting transcriptional regulator [Myxococcota bacterium]|nr:sigma 54-interacting transcriptional regulator [Myxococcota bacterium]